MSPKRLLAHFDRVADAPDVAPHLRRFVLDLAVRGKLVEQNLADEHASILLKRIAAEKARLVKAGEIKPQRMGKSRVSPPARFNLPINWAWTDLQAVCISVTDGDHLPPPKAKEGVPFLVISNVRTQTINYQSGRWVPHSYYEALDPNRRPRPGDVLYTLVGSFGIPVEVLDEKEFCVQRHIGIIRPTQQISNSFLARIMGSKFIFDQAVTSATGIAQKTVPLSGLRSFLIPLPPLAEQRCIVAKVNELMALCDRLEVTRIARENTRDRLTEASYSRLSVPDADNVTSRSLARSVVDSLPVLTARADQIKRLRQTILNLAVRGKLVEQDPADEPASNQLKRIGTEKSRLMKAGKRRSRNSTGPGVPDGIGFDLPSGWSIARFSDVLIQLQTGPFGSSLHKSDYEVGGTPVINPASIQDGKIVPTERMAVGDNTLERLSRFKLQAGDIVMGRRGEMGRCAVVSEHQDGWLCGTGSLIFRLPEDICPKYLAMLIGSPYVREYLARFAVGATMRNLNQAILSRMSIAVPPIAEQQRIVAKVDELIVLCDWLETGLGVVSTGRHRLFESLLWVQIGDVS